MNGRRTSLRVTVRKRGGWTEFCGYYAAHKIQVFPLRFQACKPFRTLSGRRRSSNGMPWRMLLDTTTIPRCCGRQGRSTRTKMSVYSHQPDRDCHTGRNSVEPESESFRLPTRSSRDQQQNTSGTLPDYRSTHGKSKNPWALRLLAYARSCLCHCRFFAESQVPLGDCADYDPSHSLDLADASRMNQMHEAPLLDLLHRCDGFWQRSAFFFRS